LLGRRKVAENAGFHAGDEPGTTNCMPEADDRILILTTQIAAAYVGANAVEARAVAGLVLVIQRSLTNLNPGGAVEPAKPAAPVLRPTRQPAVDIRKSVFSDHLVCLEDGKTFKTLTRHLGETHGMTPEQYRAKWDLPESYPLIAPEYAQRRSALARQIGLGRRVEPPPPVPGGRDLTE
jgi:predicted transcriptional regulator